jgi:hypothetical protein
MEIDELYQEVNRRKQKAIELGIPLLVMNPCLGKINYFSAWSQHDAKVFIPSEIEDLEDSESPERKSVSFRFGGHLYAYMYHEQTRAYGLDTYVTDYEFRFSVDDCLVLECQGQCEYGVEDYEKDLGTTKSQLRERGYCQAGLRWYKFTPESIGAFIEGEWITEVKKLSELIEEQQEKGQKMLRNIEAAKRKQQREDPARCEDLKRRFGIS